MKLYEAKKRKKSLILRLKERAKGESIIFGFLGSKKEFDRDSLS